MRTNRSRRLCATMVMLAALAFPTLLATGCDTEESLQAFRDNAATSVEDGVKSILDGLVDGFFAAVIPADSGLTADDTTTSGE
ncbi:MAG: hypothetical protein JXO22_16655 [Phycisphaerae bacterium]|nr:hypothetical protein [Phycisphaerae bacterium]